MPHYCLLLALIKSPPRGLDICLSPVGAALPYPRLPHRQLEGSRHWAAVQLLGRDTPSDAAPRLRRGSGSAPSQHPRASGSNTELLRGRRRRFGILHSATLYLISALGRQHARPGAELREKTLRGQSGPRQFYIAIPHPRSGITATASGEPVNSVSKCTPALAPKHSFGRVGSQRGPLVGGRMRRPGGDRRIFLSRRPTVQLDSEGGKMAEQGATLSESRGAGLPARPEPRSVSRKSP